MNFGRFLIFGGPQATGLRLCRHLHSGYHADIGADARGTETQRRRMDRTNPRELALMLWSQIPQVLRYSNVAAVRYRNSTEKTFDLYVRLHA